MATLSARVTDLAAAVRDKINLMVPRLMPSGGASGQALVKTSGANYAAGWATVSGGGGGDMLIDGGNASSVYSGPAVFDGGGA